MEESEASVGRLDRGKHGEHIEVLKHVNVSRSDSPGDHPWMANLSVEEPDALMRARPDLWEPWRVTARATRPDAGKRIWPTSIGVSDLRAQAVSPPQKQATLQLGARSTFECVIRDRFRRFTTL